MNYELTGEARQNVRDIWAYIAEHNEAAADRIIDLLLEHFKLLASVPYAGRSRGELRPGFRSFAVGEYVILYVAGTSAAGPAVEIRHILHGKRDIDRFLAQ